MHCIHRNIFTFEYMYEMYTLNYNEVYICILNLTCTKRMHCIRRNVFTFEYMYKVLAYETSLKYRT